MNYFVLFQGYLISEHTSIRLAAVRCCVAILKPFVKVYDGSHTEHKQWLLELVSHVLKCLVTTAIIDHSMFLYYILTCDDQMSLLGNAL